jgi:transglutaminase-like putative cysteine protease
MLADSDLSRLPVDYKEPLRTALAPYCGRSRGSSSVREFARPIAEAAGWRTIAFLTDLNRAIYSSFTHVVRDSGPPYPPDTTVQKCEGSCRDLAVLFCAVCRSLGIPARFVSGYEREAAFQERAYMHAWAEVYLAGGGWRGYDPSQGLAVADQHVTVAAAADARLAAPITGSYRGAAASNMEFTIEMVVVQA